MTLLTAHCSVRLPTKDFAGVTLASKDTNDDDDNDDNDDPDDP